MEPYLARHHAEGERRAAARNGDVGSAILSRAAEDGTDLLVMGAYSHSRLRELVLGGATRDRVQVDDRADADVALMAAFSANYRYLRSELSAREVALVSALGAQVAGTRDAPVYQLTCTK